MYNLTAAQAEEFIAEMMYVISFIIYSISFFNK